MVEKGDWMGKTTKGMGWICHGRGGEVRWEWDVRRVRRGEGRVRDK